MTLETLSELVRRERERRRWSYLTVEKKAEEAEQHISASTARSIEKGNHAPAPESLRALAAVFGLSYYDLLRLAGYLPEGDSSLVSVRANPPFVPEFGELAADDQEVVATLVRHLAQKNRRGEATG